MEIKKIVDYINRGYIASDTLRAPDVYYFMDMVIDDINERLQARYPTFTDWSDFVIRWNELVAGENPILSPDADEICECLPKIIRTNSNYDAFPDEYIRTVVALGVAVKFYTRDEEGEQIALDYQNRYEAALFKMVRDYHNRVPWYFQDNTGGYIDFSYNRERGPRGLHPRGIVLRGNDTRII